MVLAEGGENALVKRNITEAIQALFGIDTHKIRIMKKNGNDVKAGGQTVKQMFKKESDDDCSVGGNDCSGRLPELFGKDLPKGEESTGDRGGTCQSGVD